MIKNTAILRFKSWSDEKGSLVAIEEADSVPFQISRVYYIYGVGSGVRRGFHSHLDLEQALICVKGSVRILVEDDEASETVLLDDPATALYIGPMVWREMYDFSDDTVLLVLASRHYEPDDYEKDHGRFKVKAREYFAQKESGKQ